MIVSGEQPRSAAMNGHWRVVPRHQASRTSSGRSTDSPRPRSMHQAAAPVDPGPRPGDRAGQAHARERAAGDREIARRLAVAVDALQARHVVVEGVGPAASRVEQDPEPAAVVLGAPADVVEHHRAGQPLGFEHALHQLHRHEVPLVGLGAGDDDVAVPLGPGVRVQQALAEVAGRQQRSRGRADTASPGSRPGTRRAGRARQVDRGAARGSPRG